jgi:High potential iron-sulfur protein
MKDSANAMTRRSFIAGTIVLPALAGLLLAETTTADAKGSKAQFKYQTSPKNGQQCSKCSLFIPGSSATANGTCKLVDGSISPKGWCTAFAAKS